MNEKKLQQLFAAARRSTAPAPAPEFAGDVLRAVRQLPRERRETGILGQLNSWFPRVALGAAALIILCVALEMSDLTGTGDEGTAEPAQVFFSVENA